VLWLDIVKLSRAVYDINFVRRCSDFRVLGSVFDLSDHVRRRSAVNTGGQITEEGTGRTSAEAEKIIRNARQISSDF